MGNLAYKLMALGYKFRDFRFPRLDILKEAGIKPGFKVLDFGCGPGGYIPGTAQLATETGKVYALDMQPLAIKQVQHISRKKNLTNVETILSNGPTGLPDETIDVALLYDVFHGLSQPYEVLREMHRVLKPTGILSMNDHHMKPDDIISRITGSGLFGLLQRGEKVYNFSKVM